MSGISRRNILGLFGGLTAAFALDPERLLWRRGEKLISIPSETAFLSTEDVRLLIEKELNKLFFEPKRSSDGKLKLERTPSGFRRLYDGQPAAKPSVGSFSAIEYGAPDEEEDFPLLDDFVKQGGWSGSMQLPPLPEPAMRPPSRSEAQQQEINKFLLEAADRALRGDIEKIEPVYSVGKRMGTYWTSPTSALPDSHPFIAARMRS